MTVEISSACGEHPFFYCRQLQGHTPLAASVCLLLETT